MTKIVYFAWLREKAGCSEEDIDLPTHVRDVAGLVAWLKGRGGGFAEAFADLESVRAAVNQEHARFDHPVAPGDEVAFFPPVTGGGGAAMIRVQREDFDPGRELAAFCAGNTSVGGICTFVGVVRERTGEAAAGDAVGAMTLEHYPGMTEKELARIEAEARRRWPLEDALVIHRHGRLIPGDRIVLVATASAHRKAAFESCEFLIDWLKTRAPFWKKEETVGGERWVAARESDDAAAGRWKRERAAE